jgi:hypothetical protein
MSMLYVMMEKPGRVLAKNIYCNNFVLFIFFKLLIIIIIMSIYKNTSITEWDSPTLIKYLKKKINIKINLDINGEQISKLTVKELKNLFPHNYEKIYIAVHNRLDKEQKSLNKTPDIITIELQNKMHMSILDLNRTSHNKYEDKIIINFIVMHPPLLWQNEHILYFIDLLGFDANLIKNIDVDDIIFMEIEELNKYYPECGHFIYNAIRRRFITPQITKIKKPIKIID